MAHNFCNLISCLKNGSLAKKPKIEHNNTVFNIEVLDLLWDEGLISGYKKNSANSRKVAVFLKYDDKNRPVLSKIHVISKPGNRIHITIKNIWKIRSTNTLIIVSTSKGIKTLTQCKIDCVGGELLAVFG